MYRLTRLANGLTLITARMPHRASVSLGLWVGVGGRYESAEQSGSAHFIEHLLFKGTRRRSARQISQDVEGLGGYLNAFTSEETTCFFARACHQHLPQTLDVLMDMFLNSRFEPRELAKEREVIKEEIALYRDQPPQYVHELLNALQWPNQPLGRSITGTEATLDRLTRRRLRQYQQAAYRAANTLVVAAGRVDHDQLVQQVMPLARRLPVGPPPRCEPVRIQQTRPGLRLHTRQTEQTQLALGIRTCSRHDERRYALRLVNALLGENMSSRLFQILREERGLVYAISSSLSFFEDTGDLVISAGLDAERLAESLRLILGELRRLREILPGRSELRRAKDYVIGQSDLSLEGTENHMMWLGEQWLGYGKITPPDEIKHRLQLVTPSEIRSVACSIMQPDRLNLALVSPLKSARHLPTALCL